MSMDPLCISLVHQHLVSTKSALADQFKTKYQPEEPNVKLEKVVSKWNEEQLARNIVYQHLRTVAPSLAIEFKNTYFCSLEMVPEQLLKVVKVSQKAQPKMTKVKLEEKEEQLARSVVYQHLKVVAPSLAFAII